MSESTSRRVKKSRFSSTPPEVESTTATHSHEHSYDPSQHAQSHSHSHSHSHQHQHQHSHGHQQQQHHQDKDDENIKEAEHYVDVIMHFGHYEKYSLERMFRLEQDFARLPSHHKRLLPHLEEKFNHAKQCIHENQQLINHIIGRILITLIILLSLMILRVN